MSFALILYLCYNLGILSTDSSDLSIQVAFALKEGKMKNKNCIEETIAKALETQGYELIDLIMYPPEASASEANILSVYSCTKLPFDI